MPDRLPDFGKYIHDRYQESAVSLSVSGGDVLVFFSKDEETVLSFVVVVSDEERFLATLETAQLSYEQGLKLADYIKKGGQLLCQQIQKELIQQRLESRYFRCCSSMFPNF